MEMGAREGSAKAIFLRPALENVSLERRSDKSKFLVRSSGEVAEGGGAGQKIDGCCVVLVATLALQ